LLLAQQTLSNSDCSKIGDPVEMQQCLDMIINKQAIAAKKISLCDQIKSNSLNESCVENLINTMPGITQSDCGTLPAREQSYCFNFVSFSNLMDQFYNAKNPSDCQKISDIDVKQECLKKFIK